jgi:cytochrome c oxidase subunit IV
MQTHRPAGRLYGATWAGLLALTLVMLLVDSAPLPRGVFVTVLLAAMLLKAALIGAIFMHLRFERWTLTAMVIVGLLVTAVVLFVLIAPDAVRIAAMSRALR